jgi:hypothetical protein
MDAVLPYRAMAYNNGWANHRLLAACARLSQADFVALQRHLTRIGLYKDKLDGKAGMQTRAALGAYQKSAGLKVDCWPSEAVLRSLNAAR